MKSELLMWGRRRTHTSECGRCGWPGTMTA